MALLAVVVAAIPAWATGEKVLLTESASALRDSVCISMTCVKSGGSDVVSARAVKGGVEFTVTSTNGKVKLVERASVSPEGRVSSLDLMRVTARVVKAIEGSLPPARAAAKAPTAPVTPKLIARR